MGFKYRLIIIGFLFLKFSANAQITTDFTSVDTLTYNYYLAGKWGDVIKTGKEALYNGIDYKFLRQRMGYSYFSLGDYFEAGKQFKKALSYDSYDSFTLTWFYYSLLNSGQTESARLLAARMPLELRHKLSIRSFEPVESIQTEFNLKYAATDLRSNPVYYYIGFTSLIGPRLEIFQMASIFRQTFTIQGTDKKIFTNDRQTEYYAIAKLTVSPHLLIKTAYHYLEPTFNSVTSSGQLGFISVTGKLNRFSIEANTSILKTDVFLWQSGISSGYMFPGSLKFYIRSALSHTHKQNTDKLIFNETTGFSMTKKIWLEGNFTLGDMSDYHDHDAMYIYNFIDPCKIRTGATLFMYEGKHLSLWANFSWEKKEFYENSLYHYNQFSYLGGVKWKI